MCMKGRNYEWMGILKEWIHLTEIASSLLNLNWNKESTHKRTGSMGERYSSSICCLKEMICTHMSFNRGCRTSVKLSFLSRFSGFTQAVII